MCNSKPDTSNISQDLYKIYGLDSSAANKQHEAYNYLKTKIILGQYPPEKQLVERELCELLGVSRTPVREALRRLSSEGLVSSYPGRGVCVSKVSIEDSVHTHEYKEALEAAAARLCCERMTKEQLEQLGEAIKGQQQSYEGGMSLSAIDTDMKFHVLLIEGAHSPIIEEQAKLILWQVRRYAQLTTYDTEYTLLFVKQHIAIFEAIKSKDADAADKAVREHTSTVKNFQRERWALLFGIGSRQ